MKRSYRLLLGDGSRGLAAVVVQMWSGRPCDGCWCGAIAVVAAHTDLSGRSGSTTTSNEMQQSRRLCAVTPA